MTFKPLHDPTHLYFVTATVLGWKHLFVQQSYAEIVSGGYPRLRELGELLNEEDVSFHDATQIFADQVGTIYRDACCHYNAAGNEIFAAFVLDRILRDTDVEPLRRAR